MVLNDLESLLRKTIGLEAASVGRGLIERAVRRRMAAAGVGGVREYVARVRSSAEELQELIDAVVVPETWFFRDREAFNALRRVATQRWLAAPRREVLRLLSVPCASGEEPFSLAMTMLDAGFAPGRFRIEAVDVSTHTLKTARRAVYGRNSFRGSDLAFRDRFFTRDGDAHCLKPAVRELVQFERGNLLDQPFWAGRGPYDFIFCRNLLIYFNRSAQREAGQRLHGLLAPEGILFVGPAEASFVASDGFRPLRIPRAFAFENGVSRGPIRSGPVAPSRTRKTVAARTAGSAAPSSSFVTPEKRAVPPVLDARPRFASKLELARHLADRGDLAEAAQFCEDHMNEEGDSAPALYLLGLVRDAEGDPAEACGLYRKALYLDPDHVEALSQLALSLERAGVTDEAALLRRRACRVSAKLQP